MIGALVTSERPQEQRLWKLPVVADSYAVNFVESHPGYEDLGSV